MDTILSSLITLGGTIAGGAVGYFSSSLQWKKAIEREERLKRIADFKTLISLAYEAIEYVRDYWVNSQHMEIQEFLACMTGKDPTSRILAITVGSASELAPEAKKLRDAISELKGPEFPVPKEKFDSAVQIVNEFGASAYQYVKANS